MEDKIYNLEVSRMNEMVQKVQVRKEAIQDPVKAKENMDTITESLELMADPVFMASYVKSQEQVKKRNFVTWDAL